MTNKEFEITDEMWADGWRFIGKCDFTDFYIIKGYRLADPEDTICQFDRQLQVKFCNDRHKMDKYVRKIYRRSISVYDKGRDIKVPEKYKNHLKQEDAQIKRTDDEVFSSATSIKMSINFGDVTHSYHKAQITHEPMPWIPGHYVSHHLEPVKYSADHTVYRNGVLPVVQESKPTVVRYVHVFRAEEYVDGMSFVLNDCEDFLRNSPNYLKTIKIEVEK